jgi:hypothetical protein
MFGGGWEAASPKRGTNETRRPNTRSGDAVWGQFERREWRCSYHGKGKGITLQQPTGEMQ